MATSHPIGVGKRCCFLCWLLGELSGKEPDGLVFQLPGTHAIFYPWVPPLGVSQNMLEKMVQIVNALVHDVQPSHSRQSSGANSDVENMIRPIYMDQLTIGLAGK